MQRVYRLRPSHGRPPTQIIAFNSPSLSLLFSSAIRGATAFLGGLASHNVLFISSAPLSRRAFSPGIFIASLDNPSLPCGKFSAHTSLLSRSTQQVLITVGASSTKSGYKRQPIKVSEVIKKTQNISRVVFPRFEVTNILSHQY